MPSTGGSGGLTCLRGSVPSSEASCLRPKTMTTRPSGRALVCGPDVVILVDLDGVREGPGVEVVANFAQNFSVGGELEELRGRSAIGGADGSGPSGDATLGL